MYQPEFPPVPFRLGLYPVVDSVQWIERLLDAGVRTLQLRIKDQRDEEVEADVVAAIALGRRYNARLFINDYWRLAIKHQAYGVHLGQEDLQATDLNAIRAAGLRLGVSTHDDMEIDVALAARPSYIALGHVFPTQTKQMPSAPQGLEQLARHVERLADYPTVAIGRYQSGARACGDSNGCRQYRRRQRHYSSRRLAFGNGTAAGNCRSWR